jgi:hypothetical protein
MMAGYNGAVVLFGGCTQFNTSGVDCPGAVADTWSWNGTAWTQLSVSGPPARGFGKTVAIGNDLVLFGGFSAVLSPK